MLNEPLSAENAFEELGVSGLKRTGGFIHEEFLTGLRGTVGAKAYREMSDNDPIVGALLFAIERLILNIDWRVDAYEGEDQTQDDIDTAKFIDSCMYDMNVPWQQFISEVLSMLVYGYAFCEIVYKKRDGESEDGGSSAYDDGKIGWRKIAVRAQETTWSWQLDTKGGIQGMYQMDPNGIAAKGNIFIPIEKALLFRTTANRNNPEGRSLLRNAYRPWRFKKTIEEIEAVGIERDLAGLPVAHVPPEMLSSRATADMVMARGAIEDLVRGIKRNENEGILFPLAYDADGREQYRLSLLTTGGARQFDTDKIVARYDQRIAMTALADFILLGHENVGSFALGASKVDLFTTAIQQIARSIAQVLNQYAVPRLLKLNGIKTAHQPEITFGEIVHVDLALLGDFIQKTAGAGALVVDGGLDTYLRNLSGMPPREEKDGVMPIPEAPKPAAVPKEVVAEEAKAEDDVETEGGAPEAANLKL